MGAASSARRREHLKKRLEKDSHLLQSLSPDSRAEVMEYLSAASVGATDMPPSVAAMESIEALKSERERLKRSIRKRLEHRRERLARSPVKMAPLDGLEGTLPVAGPAHSEHARVPSAAARPEDEIFSTDSDHSHDTRSPCSSIASSIESDSSLADVMNVDLGPDFPENPSTLDEYERIVREYRRRLAAAQHAGAMAKRKRQTAEHQLRECNRTLDTQASTHRKHIEKMSQAIERLMDKNMMLNVELTTARDAASVAETRATDLENNTKVLRTLVVNHYCTPSGGTRSVVEKKFWDQIATPEVLAASQPPADFPLEMATDLSTELTKSKARVQQQTAKIKNLTAQLARLETDFSELKAKRSVNKDVRIQLRKQQTQLMGSVRRIKWLVGQQKQMHSQVTDKDQYISKLEAQLLSLTEKLKLAKTRTRQTTATGSVNMQQGFFSYWDKLLTPSHVATNTIAQTELARGEMPGSVRRSLPFAALHPSQATVATAQPDPVRPPIAVPARRSVSAGRSSVASAAAAAAGMERRPSSASSDGSSGVSAGGTRARDAKQRLLDSLQSEDFDVAEIEGWAEDVQRMAAAHRILGLQDSDEEDENE